MLVDTVFISKTKNTKPQFNMKIDFISPEDFLTPVYAHLKLHMQKEGWSTDVGITEIANCLLVAHDRLADTGPVPEKPRFVMAYFEPLYHQPLTTLPAWILPSGIVAWQSTTHNLRDAIAFLEHQMTHSEHALRRPERFFGSLADLEIYKGKE